MPVFSYNGLYHSNPGPEDIFRGNLRIHGLKDLLIQVPLPGQKQYFFDFVLLDIAKDPLTESHNVDSRIDKSYFIVRTVLPGAAVQLCIDDSPVGRTCQP